jgi:hypothetical protein
MKMRLLFSALALLCFLHAAAAACPAQTGKVIFDDSFTDESGGWQLGAPDTEIKDGALWLHPNPRGLNEKGRDIQATVRTFSATDGDYCMEFVVPNPVAADNDVMTGLVFWQVSSSEEYLWATYTDGSARLNRLVANKWSRVLAESVAKLEPGALASLRVIAKDAKLTLFVGDKQVKVVRAQPPGGVLTFGVLAEVEKLSDANPAVQIKSYKVTAPE